jgi:hypothetical protein
MKRSILRAGVVLAIGVAVLPGLSGVAQAGDVADRWYGDPATSWDADDHPDCGAALAKVYVAGAAGAVGGPAGLVAGAAGALPDVYLDCPQVQPHQQNGT